MMILRDGSAASLHPFVTEHVEPGATVITDAWQGYRGINKLGYTHEPRSQRAARARGQDPGELLPGVHRVASLVKRWLQLGTHQGSVDEAHLQGYLNEFVFRFNRRGSRSRGLVFHRVLELAVAHDPVRYRDLVVNPQPKAAPPVPAGHTGAPAEHGPPSSGAAMESILTWVSPVREYARGAIMQEPTSPREVPHPLWDPPSPYGEPGAVPKRRGHGSPPAGRLQHERHGVHHQLR